MSLTPNMGAWFAGGFMQTQWSTLASIKWGVIQDKPTSVRILRNGEALDEQIVRVEFEDTIINDDSEIGFNTMKRGTIHGVKGHPTVDDTDIKQWDVLIMGEVEYTVVFVNDQLIGEVQAEFEAH